MKGVDRLLDTRLLAYDYYVGFDVGKFSHHATVIRGADQQVVFSEEVLQDEAEIRKVIASFSSKGRTLVTVDQKGSIGRLITSLAKDMGVDVGFLTPTDFHHFSEGYSEVKTDAVDAYEITDLSLRMTHLLLAVEKVNEILEVLRLLSIRRSDRPLI
jgi:hypothetical protein